MSHRQFFIDRWKAESPLFVKMLRALPEGQLEYKPHERSPSAGQLAWLIAEEARSGATLIREVGADWEQRSHPGTFAEIIEAYERSAAELASLLESVDDETWNKSADFRMNGEVVFSAPVGEQLWWILFDAIHHRGQLSAYVRPMGGKVPGIYGPSADDTGN
jgi:uncharacterized damage-inducible protein DinB